MSRKVTLKFIQNLLSVSQTTAWTKRKIARDALNKKQHEILTEKEFCAYYDILG